jgi:hypothetical protein
MLRRRLALTILKEGLHFTVTLTSIAICMEAWSFLATHPCSLVSQYRMQKEVTALPHGHEGQDHCSRTLTLCLDWWFYSHVAQHVPKPFVPKAGGW